MSEFDKKCSKCRNYNGNILICESCAHYKPKQTVFQRITASPEVLAEKLVYEDFGGWWSVLFDDDCNWDSRDEAIAATLEELNKVSK